MIHSIQQELTLSIPLTLTSHSQAQLFYQRHAEPHKAKQVYLNTLAVEAVRTYLSWLGVDSDLQSSDSWDPVIQALSDIADLVLSGQGKLECRPVLPGATTCYIPPETNGDRIGYLPVLFDNDLESATLLGFIPSTDITLETEEVSLSKLQPVTALFDVLKPTASPAEPIQLGQWLKGAIASGWQTVEALLDPQPVYSFRSADLAMSESMASTVVRGKLLELKPLALSHLYNLQPNSAALDNRQIAETFSLGQRASQLYGCQVALVIGITQGDALQSDVWVKLCPVGGDRHLPEALEIRILDDQGVAVMEAQSRQTDTLQLNFRGMLNEQFTIEVALSDVSLMEKFVI